LVPVSRIAKVKIAGTGRPDYRFNEQLLQHHKARDYSSTVGLARTPPFPMKSEVRAGFARYIAKACAAMVACQDSSCFCIRSATTLFPKQIL
jgi:hypothetical protein